jgi:hypothetical protein
MRHSGERELAVGRQTIFDLLVSRTLASVVVRFLKDALSAKKIIEAGAAVWVGPLFRFSFVLRRVDFDFSHYCLLDVFGLLSLRSGLPSGSDGGQHIRFLK